ncbi:MAG: hypothetical protein DRI84_10595 [Bacteroidetes bacterium]|nr:MAG: hypothetical protein DRI84_10595 [Bacteroidota bacterium]
MHPSDIRIGQNEYRAYQLTKFIQDGRLKLEEKKNWNNKNMSMSIESILLGLTMTPIYIDASNPESWFVLDGRKRLQSLYRFFNGNFALTELEFFPDLNDCEFSDLPYPLQNKLEEALFTIYSINQGVSERVRLSLVLRIVPDLKSALSWEFKESLLDNSLKELLQDWLKYPAYDFVKSRFNPKSDLQLLLEYLRLILIGHDDTNINLHTNIEHVIFQLNANPILNQSEWNLGIDRITQIFGRDDSYLNKKTLPILIFYFGTRIDDVLYDRIHNDVNLFLERWKGFYLNIGKKLFRRNNSGNIYNELDRLI